MIHNNCFMRVFACFIGLYLFFFLYIGILLPIYCLFHGIPVGLYPVNNIYDLRFTNCDF